VFRTVLTVNSDCFPQEQQSAGFCSEASCASYEVWTRLTYSVEFHLWGVNSLFAIDTAHKSTRVVPHMSTCTKTCDGGKTKVRGRCHGNLLHNCGSFISRHTATMFVAPRQYGGGCRSNDTNRQTRMQTMSGFTSE
jgi:hypothetical protein